MAVGVERISEVPENIITEEQRKGYKRGNQVIRYAEVVVAKRAIKN
ncbi:MAG: nucleotide exchange factor GrpE [Candidatus Bathyarchaeia archaeon]